MKKALLLVFTILIAQIVSAEPDTATIHQYLRNGRAYQLSQPDSAILLAERALKLSQDQEYHDGIVTANNLIGMSYWVKGEFNKGLEYMNIVLEKTTAMNDTSEMATAYGNTGILYIDMGDKDMGLQYSKKAIELYNAIGEYKSAVHYINNIGWIYESKEMYDSSLFYYERAYNGYKEYYKGTAWLGQTIANISSLYSKIEEPEPALKYAQEALRINTYKDNQKVLGHCYLSMSKALLINKDYKNAIKYADSALNLALSKNINTLVSEAYLLLYKGNEKLGNYKAAINFFKLNRKWADSLVNEETDSKLSAIKTELATEKKNKELAIANAANERKVYYLLFAGMLLISVCAIAYLIYLKQKHRIKAKHKQLELEQKEKELVALDLENQELLNHELNKELLTYTLTTAQKNQLLQEINDELNNLNSSEQGELRKLKHSINIAMNTEEDWDEFKLRFEQVHQSFFENLIAKHPQLSPNDLRLSSFIKLNLNSKQIASLLNIAPSSVDISKYRLKKKLHLNKEDNLTEYIANT